MWLDYGVCPDAFDEKQGTIARISAIPIDVKYLLPSCTDRRPLGIMLGHGHPRLAGAPERTAVADVTRAGYGLRTSCCVGYAVRG